ncbi:MAG: hypothetical protein JSS30_00020 [Verrucomicrobia bacterium]|nr:hypothetical protein [Verrucomicrobiota bacterium]
MESKPVYPTLPQSSSLEDSIPLGYAEDCQPKEQVKPSIPNVTPVTTPSGTDVKMQKIFYGIIAGFAIAIGYLALVIGSAPSILLAIPTLTVGGYLVWKIVRMKDYGDPIELQKYRNQAARQPLEATAIEHGWENMFQFGIPVQEDFNKLYDTYIEKFTFRDGTLIGAYQPLKTCLDHCVKMGKTVQIEIPAPIAYIAKFKTEIDGKTLTEIFNEFPIEQLVDYQLLSEDKLELFKAYGEALRQRTRELRIAKDKTQDNWEERLNTYETCLRQAQPQTVLQKEWVKMELQNMASLRRSDSTSFAKSNMSDEEIGPLKQLFDTGLQLKTELVAWKIQLKEQIAAIEKALDDKIALINQQEPLAS